MNDAAGALIFHSSGRALWHSDLCGDCRGDDELCVHWAHRHTGLCAALRGAVTMVLVVIGASIAIEVVARLFA